MLKKQYKTEKGFNIRLEARLKNADLIRAREDAGLSPKEAAKKIGISYGYYLSCEAMTNYPSKETQKKICDFYIKLGHPLFEEDIFPEELKQFEPRKYIAEKRISKPELISLSSVDKKLLPIVEAEVIEREVENKELRERLNELLGEFSDRDQQVIKMRYEEDKTYKEIAKILNLSGQRVSEIHSSILRKLRHPSRHKKFQEFL